MSTCDAVAECGEYAATPGTACPLNVCCSKHGSCGGQSTRDIYIGYYESWNRNRPCDVILPERINVQPWTNLYYSFALINGADSTITTMNSWDEKDYVKFNTLKKKKHSLKTYIAVGGWDAGGETFSAMVRFPGTRRAFIQSSLEFMEKYGFDGIDIDWEYPVADDRGGNPLDKARLVTFMKELKEACGDRYGVTITLPASYWYLQGFDVEGMLPYVDHYNVMSYDIHGTWDGNSEHTEPVINPHTNLTEIAQGLDLLWRNNVDPSKVNLGLAFYGRSFKLDDPSCDVPGCPFHQPSGGGANPGSCTGTSGILSNYEVHRIFENYDPDVVYDAEAGVNWITWANDQWISFDNARTLRQKADFANGQCLAGLFSWAIDFGGPGSLTDPNDLSLDDTSMGGAEPDGSSGGSGDIYMEDRIQYIWHIYKGFSR
ncbi:glycoside hydrolase superfamily [Aspergillus spectabilis]